MIIGDPYQFAIFIQTIEEWNIDRTFCNGVLLFCLNGILFPKEVVTASLASEIVPLRENLQNIVLDKEIFGLGKEEAFESMYNATFSDDTDAPSFTITPMEFSDQNHYAFAVSNGTQVRILAAKLKYIKAQSRHKLKDAEIIETFLSAEALGEMVSILGSSS